VRVSLSPVAPVERIHRLVADARERACDADIHCTVCDRRLCRVVRNWRKPRFLFLPPSATPTLDPATHCRYCSRPI